MLYPIPLVLDTNVLASAVYFGGTPRSILDAWQQTYIDLIVSREICLEYRATFKKLANRFSSPTSLKWIDIIEQYSTMIETPPLPNQVCTDPDDDMFLACNLANLSQFCDVLTVCHSYFLVFSRRSRAAHLPVQLLQGLS